MPILIPPTPDERVAALEAQVARQRDILDQVRAVCDATVDEEFFGHTEQARIPVTTIYRALGEA